MTIKHCAPAAGVLDDDAAGVLVPLVAEAADDVPPTLPSAVVVDSAPAVLEELFIGYGVDVGTGVVDDDEAALAAAVVVEVLDPTEGEEVTHQASAA